MACVIAAMSQVLVALPVLPPTGLIPVAESQLVFLTNTIRNATSADIPDYSAFVQVAAWLNGGQYWTE